MWRATLLVLSATTSIAQQLGPNGEIIDCAGVCACADASQSNGWHDQGTGQDRLSLRVRVPNWRSGLRVTGTWAEFITVDDVYSATHVVGAGTGDHSVTVELAAVSSADAAFVIMGHGTQAMPTSFSCKNVTAAASTETPAGGASPSVVDWYRRTTDCDLGAHWMVTNPYPQLSDVKVTLDRWEAGRVVVLSFAELDMNPLNPQFATIREWEVNERTVVTLVLGSLGTERLCHTGHVDESGVYVRDVNCARSAGSVDQPLFFSFQLQCPTCTSTPQQPDIICHELSPPPPAQTAGAAMTTGQPAVVSPTPTSGASLTAAAALQSGVTSAVYRHTSPSPPPLISPPPSPPRVEATQCPSGGVAEVQRHIHRQNEKEILHIVVRPTQWWPTGFVYEIGLRGLNLHVWENTEGATMQEPQQQNFGEMDVHRFVFAPEQAHPSFAFNVDGVDVILVSLSCYMQQSPPRPPLASPPPPSPASPSRAQLTFTYGLRSFSSRAAAAVIAILIIGKLLSYMWHTCLRRLCCGDGGRTVISASEGVGDASMAVADDCWSVLFVFGGTEQETQLSQSAASSIDDLREELAALAIETVGSKVSPAVWRTGDLQTMRVQYVDADDSPITMQSSTRFTELRDSPYLRVSQKR